MFSSTHPGTAAGNAHLPYPTLPVRIFQVARARLVTLTQGRFTRACAARDRDVRAAGVCWWAGGCGRTHPSSRPPGINATPTARVSSRAIQQNLLLLRDPHAHDDRAEAVAAMGSVAMDSDYGAPRELSALQKARALYQPELPPCLQVGTPPSPPTLATPLPLAGAAAGEPLGTGSASPPCALRRSRLRPDRSVSPSLSRRG